MTYIMRKATKLEDVRRAINQIESLPDTILALKQILGEVWEKGYQYSQTEIIDDLTTVISQAPNKGPGL